MHLLVCSFSYLPTRDGVAAAAAVAEGLAARGHCVEIATTWLAEREPQPEANPRVHQFRVEGDPLHGYRGEVAAFLQFVSDFSGDFIICHAWYSWPMELVKSAPRGRVPRILVSHGFSAQTVDWHPRFAWGLGLWLRWQPYLWRTPAFLRRYDWIVFLSQRADFGRFFDHWIARATGFTNCSVIPNGTTPGRFDLPRGAFRQAYGLGEACVFLCVANYSPRKNQALAVRAFHRARLPGAVLVFIGSEIEAYAEEVMAVHRRLAGPGSGQVLFLEKVSTDLTTSAFVDCDAFVLSARAETQPIAVLEAMASSRPFISTDTGCVADFSGGLIAHDEAEFAAHLTRLSGDAKLRTQLGQEGRRAVNDVYSWPRVVNAYENLLQRLVTEKR